MSEVIDLTEAQYRQGYQLRLQFSEIRSRGGACFGLRCPFSEDQEHIQIQYYLNPDRSTTSIMES